MNDKTLKCHKVNKMAKEIAKNQGNIIIVSGSRGCSKKWLQQFALSRQFSEKGTVAHISTRGTRYSELADAEEIK